MAIPQNPLSPMPWEQNGFLRVKVEAEEASLSQVQKCSPVNTAHTEAARLRFRGFCYKEAASPYEALAQLRELCRQWLQPEVHTKDQMLEQLVLEQFLGMLPPEIQAWVGAQHPESGEEAAVLVAELTQLLDRRGWEPGSELSEASYKQSDLAESDGATETLLGVVSPGCAFGDACEPQGSSERREGPSGEVWTMSVTRASDSRKTSGPHKNATDQLGCESGALGDSPNVWPHFTSQEKTPSKENSSALASFRMEPPCAPSGRASTTCGDCGNTVLSAWALEVHRKSHPRKTPYTCSQCGKAFRRSTHLAQHQVVHTGAKPHACKDCGKAFSRVTHLTQHQRVHTGEKPYKCGDCGKAFRRSTHLTQHRRTHTGERPYTCDACGKAFSQSTHLTQHRRVHTGEKPYKCGYCGRAFSDCSTLIRHLRTHSGEKPYRCHVCPKAFAQSSSLTEHQRVHTG